MASVYDKVKYINWYKEAVFIDLNYTDWLQLIDKLDFDNRLEVVRGMKTIRSLYYSGYWAYDTAKNHLFWYNQGQFRFEIITFHLTENEDFVSLTGAQARKLFTEEMDGGKWQKRYGCLYQSDRVYSKEFDLSHVQLVQMLHNINRCVGPFIGNDFRDDMLIESGLWKADVASAYPFNSLDNLPDLHTAELEYGWVEPSKEWPVIFYLETHNIAELDGPDTRKEQNHYLYRNFRNKGRNRRYTKDGKYKDEDPISFIPPQPQELCLKCKYAEKGLRDEMLHFFDLKSLGDRTAKEIINKVIGTLDYVVLDKETKSRVISLDYDKKNKEGEIERVYYTRYGYYGHLRALILARHNHNMIRYYDEIAEKGYKFICIQTDSLMWQGDDKIDSAVENKEIGSLVLEIKNGYGYINGCGIYYVADGNREIIKCQGLRNFKKENVHSVETFIKEIERKRVATEEFDLDTLKMVPIETEKEIKICLTHLN